MPRITIRLSSALAERLSARVSQGTPLSDVVRQAIEAYLDAPPSSLLSLETSDVADTLATLAGIVTRLDRLDQRTTALEAMSDSVRQRQTPPTDPILAQMLAWHQEGMSLRKVAARLNAEGIPTRSGTGQWHQSNISRELARLKART